MKSLYLIPLLFLSACSTTPKLTLRPQPSLPVAETVRYPEVLRAYHFGRYVDPNDDSVMHGQHTVFRVEENSRWNLHPANDGNEFTLPPSPHDAAFNPTPVNDAVLAEVNAQKLATIQILMQGRSLSAALAPAVFTALLAVDARAPWLLLAVAMVGGAAMLVRLERHLPVTA